MPRSAMVWIFGLVLFGVLTWMCIDHHVPQIEADIEQRVGAALQQAGLTGARVLYVEGLDVVIGGNIDNEYQRGRAVDVVKTVHGVRNVRDELQVTAPVLREPPKSTLVFTAEYREGSLTLGGAVRDDATRASLVGFARRIFDSQRVIDRLSVVTDTPERWSTITRASLEQLAKLTSGSFELTDSHIQFTGTASSDYLRQDAESAVTERLGPSYTSHFEIAVSSTAAGRARVCQSDINRILETNAIRFTTGSDVISVDSHPLLDRLAATLDGCSGLALEVQGHTDSSGDAAANERLSELRARAVLRYLRDEGLDTSRLSARGYGASRPVADNATVAGRAKNRRIEIILVEN